MTQAPPVAPDPLPALNAPDEQGAPGTFRIVLLSAVAFLVGWAIHIRDGEYELTGTFNSRPIVRIAGALLCAVAAVLVPRWLRGRRAWRDVALAAVMAAAVAQFVMLFRAPPGGWNDWSDDLKDKAPSNLALYYGGVTAAAALVLIAVAARRRFWVYPFGLLLLVHLGLGGWMVLSSPEPKIDVWQFQQIGGRALLAGDTPYRWTDPQGNPRYPNIYFDPTKEPEQAVYGTKQAPGPWLATGFPYTPVSLFVSTAGYAAGGDHRYAQAACLTLAGLLLAAARPGGWGALAAVLLLFTPRAFFVLGRGWSEPIVVLFLALTVFTAFRLPRLLPIALGLLLASKQYMVFAVPLAWLLVPDPRDWRAGLKLVGGGLLVAAVVTLPLALWDLKAFWESAVVTQLDAPFRRRDALSFLVWMVDAGGHRDDPAWNPPLWLAFPAALLALVIALRYCPRTPAGFCTGLVAVYLPFIAFNKQAFANYYLFVIAAAACAIGALRPEPPPARKASVAS